jgi:hypothetical protein
LAVAEMPNSVCAADDGKSAGAGIVGAAGQLFVYRFQRCSVNMDNDLAVPSDWLGELFTAGRCPKRV